MRRFPFTTVLATLAISYSIVSNPCRAENAASDATKLQKTAQSEQAASVVDQQKAAQEAAEGQKLRAKRHAARAKREQKEALQDENKATKEDEKAAAQGTL